MSELIVTTFEKIKKAIAALFVPIHSVGWVYIGSLVLVTLILWLWNFSDLLGNISFLLALLSVIYFRAPERITADNKNMILAPVDGVIDSITQDSIPGADPKEKLSKVSVFVNFYDSKVIYSSVEGEVMEKKHVDKKTNTRNMVKLKSRNHGEIFIGLNGCSMLPKSTICNVIKKQKLGLGEEFGFLTFGQYVDIYFPKTANINVKAGQRVTAAETALASSSAGAKIAASFTKTKKVSSKPTVKKSAVKSKTKKKTKKTTISKKSS